MSSSRGTSHQLIFIYTAASNGATKSLRFMLPEESQIAGDGAFHNVLLAVSSTDNTATITVDDGAPMQQKMVAGGVDDCGTSQRLPSGDATDCGFAVGQRLSTTSAYAFDGRIIGARLYPDVALSEFPVTLTEEIEDRSTATTSEAPETTTEEPTTYTETTTEEPTTEAKCVPGFFRGDGEDAGSCRPFTACRYGCGAGCSEVSQCSEHCVGCILNDDSSSCLRCDDGKYMYDSRCHDDCDAFANTKPVGNDMAGRECVAVTDDAKRPGPPVEFIEVAGTASSDRVCTPRSPCGPGSYIVAAWTTTSDVVCVTCPSGYTDHDADPTTPCQKCSQGQYSPGGSTGTCESKACPAGTSDTDKSATTQCEICPAGTYAPAGGSTDACSSFACAAGTVDEDSDSRTPCVSCDGISGVYVPEGSSGSCSSHFCAPGTVDLDGMPSTACQACNGVTEYQNKEGQRKCVAVTDCPAGEQEEVAPTPVMDRLCAQCLAGRTFLPEGGNDCVDVSPECGDGFYESKAPTATSDRVCTATTTTSTTTTTTDPCEGVDCSGDSCHEDGTCVNGMCIEGKALADGITCDENTPCLKAGVCLSGGCVATRAKPNGAACFSEHCHGIGEGVCQDGKCGVVDFNNGNAIGWLECDTTTTPTTTATSTETRFSSCSVGFYEVFDCSWYKTKNECSSSDDGFHCSFDNDAGLCMLKSNFTTSTDPDRHRRQSHVQVGGSGDALCITKELEEPCNSQKGCAWISMFGFNFCDVTANALHARSRRQGGNMFGGGGGKNADIVQRTLPILSWSPLQQPLKPARLLFNVREWIVSFMRQCISTRSNAT